MKMRIFSHFCNSRRKLESNTDQRPDDENVVDFLSQIRLSASKFLNLCEGGIEEDVQADVSTQKGSNKVYNHRATTSAGCAPHQAPTDQQRHQAREKCRQTHLILLTGSTIADRSGIGCAFTALPQRHRAQNGEVDDAQGVGPFLKLRERLVDERHNRVDRGNDYGCNGT